MKKLSIFLIVIFIINISKAQWQQTGINNYYISSLYLNGNNIYAGGEVSGGNYNSSVLLSTNEGATWTSISTGLPIQDNVRTIVKKGNKIYAATGINGIYESSDNGVHWNAISTYFSYPQLLAVNDSSILAGSGEFVYASYDYGESWISLDSNLSNGWVEVSSLTVNGKYIFAGLGYNSSWGEGGGMYISSDKGINWTFTTFVGHYYGVSSIAIKDSNVYAGTDHGVFISTDNGINWTYKYFGMPINCYINSIAVKDSIILAGTNYGVYISTNNGNNWALANTGLTNLYINSITIGDSIVYATTNGSNSVWKRQLTNFFSVPDSVGIITGPTIVCQGQSSVTYTIYPVNFATSYEWTLPDGIIDTVMTTNYPISVNVDFPNDTSSAFISVKGLNSYGSGVPSILAVTVKPLPSTAEIISGASLVCQNNTETYTVSSIDNATSYVWSLLSGEIDTTVFNTINIYFDTNSISGYISIKGLNSCGLGNENNMFINVTPLPITPNIIGMPNPEPFSTEFYSVSQQINKTYNWTITNGNILSGLGSNYVNIQWGNTGVGQLNVIVTDINNPNCSSASSLNVNIGYLGIESLEDNNGIIIYPNPTTDNLTIETNTKTEQRLEIINLIGQTVYTSYINKKAMVNTSAFAKGVYILKLYNDKETVVKKFIKD